jgi:hypothetical protein
MALSPSEILKRSIFNDMMALNCSPALSIASKGSLLILGYGGAEAVIGFG